MLIVLHIRLFLMSYDSGAMSLADSEINYELLLVKLIFDRIIHLMFHILGCVPNS